MRLTWNVTARDVARVRELMSAADRHPLVVSRRRRNLAATKPRVSKRAFWHALVGALLTTQQRSGPTRPVTRFLATRPFPLSYPLQSGRGGVAATVTRTLASFGGIRRSTVIGRELAENQAALDESLWPETLSRLEVLRSRTTVAIERDAADFFADNLLGIGPKQSRNLLQALGLTRYEIPLDSRLTKWLNEFGFPFKLSAAGLSDRHYYEVVSDGVQALCAAVGVFPCLFDAAVFASFDGSEWTEDSATVWGHDGG